MPSGLLLSDDLMFTSRVTGTARDLGLKVQAAKSAGALLLLASQQPPSCVIIDLANPGLIIADLVRQLQEACPALPRLIAYGSHVDAATLRTARDAGCTEVLPRSKFVEDLPRKLPEWMQ